LTKILKIESAVGAFSRTQINQKFKNLIKKLSLKKARQYSRRSRYSLGLLGTTGSSKDDI